MRRVFHVAVQGVERCVHMVTWTAGEAGCVHVCTLTYLLRRRDFYEFKSIKHSRFPVPLSSTKCACTHEFGDACKLYSMDILVRPAVRRR